MILRAAAAFDGHRRLGPTEVTVEGDRIASVRPATGPADVAFLSPGFTDAHVHPIQGGLERLRCDLSGESTREGYLAAVQAYADANPDTSWTVWAYLAALGAVLALGAGVFALRQVRGWPEMGTRYDAPTGAAEDAVAPGRPVEEQSSIDIWKSLDEGEDPTA